MVVAKAILSRGGSLATTQEPTLLYSKLRNLKKKGDICGKCITKSKIYKLSKNYDQIRRTCERMCEKLWFRAEIPFQDTGNCCVTLVSLQYSNK